MWNKIYTAGQNTCYGSLLTKTSNFLGVPKFGFGPYEIMINTIFSYLYFFFYKISLVNTTFETLS